MYIYYVVCYNYLPSHLWELALFSLTLRVEVWTMKLDWPRHFLFSYRGGMVGDRVLEVSNLSLSVISLLDFRNVTAVWWFCFLFFVFLPFRLIFVFDNITTWITLFHRLRLKEYEVYIFIWGWFVLLRNIWWWKCNFWFASCLSELWFKFQLEWGSL